ncbi:hypothetical protein PCIT_a2746 [Pseudoalteromonas citrea]|uniref:OmpR/PhoB-type domain-containing protein n=2 Tax=Pseudoalteromonas citrea TaxID=43655 RepID=A0AAD4FRF3_9GAMM|nr:winged helix-turn-helix domain-containing protein [Pseudoalteromonas citrea]KAF7769838.1 hypothetical protein PCIT_a2746 [Pseudoalteromonas citrea]
MKVRFNHFEFDCDSLILTKQARIFSLNEKPAQLLSFLLTEHKKINSKESILTHVWPERVVTEQVVFQNISYLRALFGDKAIKTYPKKGYQWQIAFSTIDTLTEQAQFSAENTSCDLADLAKPTPSPLKSDQIEAINIVPITKPSKPIDNPTEIISSPPITELNKTQQISAEKPATGKEKHSSGLNYWMLAAVSILLSIFIFFYLSQNKTVSIEVSKMQKKISVLQFLQHKPGLAPEPIPLVLASDQFIEFLTSEQPIKSQELFDSPYRSWQQLSQSAEQLVLSGKFYPLADDTILLRFYVQGAHRGWQGYISAQTQEHATLQLRAFIKTVAGSDYFSLKPASAALAQLTVLHNQQPDNLFFLHKLILSHYELEHLDMASALAVRLR